MAILYTVDSMTVDKDEFKDRISDTGYYDLPQGERTWTHIPATRQIIMAKTLHGNDGSGKPAICIETLEQTFFIQIKVCPMCGRNWRSE